MPRKNGLEFLQEIRRDDSLCGITVFVLTTSNNEQDRLAAYRHHIAGYLVKSDADEEFTEIIRMLGQFLLTVRFSETLPGTTLAMAATAQ